MSWRVERVGVIAGRASSWAVRIHMEVAPSASKRYTDRSSRALLNTNRKPTRPRQTGARGRILFVLIEDGGG